MSFLRNLVLTLVSISVFYTALEVFVWRPNLERVPLTLHDQLGRLKPLAQTSKRGLVPQDYVLILGDSYAEGLGDWLMKVVGDGNPPYNAGHLLHDLTGRDVLSFGMRGGHAVFSHIYNMEKSYTGLAQYVGLNVGPPSEILAFYFEGNDVNDDVAFMEDEIAKRSVGELASDDAFLEGVVARMAEHGAHAGSRRWHALRNAHLLDTSTKLAKLVVKNLGSSAQSALSGGDPSFRVGGTYRENWTRYEQSQDRVWAAGEKRPYPALTVEPFVFQTDPEMALSAGLFKHSIAYLRKRFPASRITAVYIPAPINVYRLAQRGIELRHRIRSHGKERAGDPTFIPVEKLGERSDALCGKVEAAANDAGAVFYDSRTALRAASVASGYLHGPNDPLHFNKAGYTAFAGILADALAQPRSSTCASLTDLNAKTSPR